MILRLIELEVCEVEVVPGRWTWVNLKFLLCTEMNWVHEMQPVLRRSIDRVELRFNVTVRRVTRESFDETPPVVFYGLLQQDS